MLNDSLQPTTKAVAEFDVKGLCNVKRLKCLIFESGEADRVRPRPFLSLNVVAYVRRRADSEEVSYHSLWAHCPGPTAVSSYEVKRCTTAASSS